MGNSVTKALKILTSMGKMVVTKEVTKGVFDPRTYREDDPVNWARKRRSDWLATPGQIHYVRERTVVEILKKQSKDKREKLQERLNHLQHLKEKSSRCHPWRFQLE